MKTPLYLGYGVLMIALTFLAQYRGWTMSSANQAKTTPRTVRDNPGGIGPVYGGSPRYSGGK